MHCASITVTFYPDILCLVRQLQSIPQDWTRIIVDNGTPMEEWGRVASAIAEFPGIEVLRLEANHGLAAAQNRGMEYLSAGGICTHVLFLDQDSEPLSDAARELATVYSSLSADGDCAVAVGPMLRDPVTGVQHGFQRLEGWRWVRVFPNTAVPVSCTCLNGSGTFMSLKLAMDLGGMDEGLFIDHVDTDWSFRLLARSVLLYGVPSALFAHRMGDRTTRLWFFGWRVWPIRSPLRHRYLFRNAILLLKRPYVPYPWKLWAVVKLMLTLAVFVISGPRRFAQASNMLAGIRDGVLGRSGPL